VTNSTLDYLLKDEDWKVLEDMKERMLGECDECDHTGHRLAKDQSRKAAWTKTEECSCLKRFKRYKEYYKSRIPEIYWKLNDKNFEGDKSALKLVMRYNEKIHNAVAKGLGFLFYGNNGNGKTTLSCIIAKHAIKNGYSVLYGTLQSYLNMVMDSFGSDAQTEKVRDLIKNVDVLIIDELGKEHVKRNEATGTVFGFSEFEQILRHREGKNKVVIEITNLRPQQLESQYGASIASLFEGALKKVEVTGPDMRRTLKSKSWEKRLEGKE